MTLRPQAYPASAWRGAPSRSLDGGTTVVLKHVRVVAAYLNGSRNGFQIRLRLYALLERHDVTGASLGPSHSSNGPRFTSTRPK